MKDVALTEEAASSADGDGIHFKDAQPAACSHEQEGTKRLPVPDHYTTTKKRRVVNPSLLKSVRPINLETSMDQFFASDCSVAPRFEYTHPQEHVQKLFEANNKVDFDLLPEAERILKKVEEEYGGAVSFNRCLYGDEQISSVELKEVVQQYVRDLGLEDKAVVRVNDKLMSAANVVRAERRYIVNVTPEEVSKQMVQGICDHEVGTHLLRMVNDEHQVWHSNRDRYNLLDPWTTEEGLATLNTFLSIECKLLYPQALRYWAVCRAAHLGFVELFHELEGHIQDPKKRFQMCCRIKRGLVDTSLPEAFNRDQTYFKGAVEILRHFNEIDFGRLYCGRVALQDLDKIHFLFRKDFVRFPKFLNSYEASKAYKDHCRSLIKQNEISTSGDQVCKPLLNRWGKEFFKEPIQQATERRNSSKAQRRATISVAKAVSKTKKRQRTSGSGRRGSSEPAQGTINTDEEVVEVVEVSECDDQLGTSPKRSIQSICLLNLDANLVKRSMSMDRIRELSKPRSSSVGTTMQIAPEFQKERKHSQKIRKSKTQPEVAQRLSILNLDDLCDPHSCVPGHGMLDDEAVDLEHREAIRTNSEHDVYNSDSSSIDWASKEASVCLTSVDEASFCLAEIILAPKLQETSEVSLPDNGMVARAGSETAHVKLTLKELKKIRRFILLMYCFFITAASLCVFYALGHLEL